MSDKCGAKHVYYHFVEGSRFLLADERDKWRFLESVRVIQQKKNWEIYAFCLTDRGAYFVIESSGIFEVQKELMQAAGYIGETPAHEVFLQEQNSTILNSGYKELHSLQEITGQCMLLHRIPLDLGYVGRISDYWWSSYNSYMGIYQWALVNCRPVSLYFSADPEEARNRFRRFHIKKQGETL